MQPVQGLQKQIQVGAGARHKTFFIIKSIVGIILFSISSIGDIMTGLSVAHWPENEVQKLSGGWSPDLKHIDREVSAYLGDFSDQFRQRSRTAKMLHTTFFLSHYLWRNIIYYNAP